MTRIAFLLVFLFWAAAAPASLAGMSGGGGGGGRGGGSAAASASSGGGSPSVRVGSGTSVRAVKPGPTLRQRQAGLPLTAAGDEFRAPIGDGRRRAAARSLARAGQFVDAPPIVPPLAASASAAAVNVAGPARILDRAVVNTAGGAPIVVSVAGGAVILPRRGDAVIFEPDGGRTIVTESFRITQRRGHAIIAVPGPAVVVRDDTGAIDIVSRAEIR
jgi:hypothetical protein